jgi:hypothetical protein
MGSDRNSGCKAHTMCKAASPSQLNLIKTDESDLAVSATGGGQRTPPMRMQKPLTDRLDHDPTTIRVANIISIDVESSVRVRPGTRI